MNYEKIWMQLKGTALARKRAHGETDWDEILDMMTRMELDHYTDGDYSWVLNGTLSDGSCVKLNLSITDCNQCKWQGLRRHKCPIDTDFVYDAG